MNIYDEQDPYGIDSPEKPKPLVTPGYDYGKFQNAWLNQRPAGQSAQDFINAHPEFTQGATVSNGGEWLNLPGGQSFDAQKDFGVGGENKAQWGSREYDYATGRKYTADEANAAEAQWYAANGGAPNATGGGQSSSQSSQPSQDSALRDLLIKQLTARAQQGTAIDRNDPNIRAQADPYAAQQERASRNFLADMAERQGPLANLQGQARVAAEHAGQNSGLFEAQLIGRELESRRAEITDALTQLRGMLTTEQTIALQQQLAELDDATKRLGIEYQNSQAQGQLGLGYSQFDWNTSPLNPNNIRNFNSPA